MKLIKFYIYKLKPNYLSLGKYNMKDIHDHKVVGVIGYLKYRKRGWKLNSIDYFIFSKIKYSWSKLSLGNKISIIGIILGVGISIILFLLDKWLII